MRFVFVFLMVLSSVKVYGQPEFKALNLSDSDYSSGDITNLTQHYIHLDAFDQDSLHSIFKEAFQELKNDSSGAYALIKIDAGIAHQKLAIVFNQSIGRIHVIIDPEIIRRRKFVTGSQVSTDRRAYRMSFVNIIPVDFGAGQSYHLLVRFTDPEDRTLTAELKDFEQLNLKVERRLTVSYIFTAILFTFAVYNLILAFLIKRRVYYYYSFYIFTFSLYASLISLTLIFTPNVVAPLSIISAAALMSVGALFSGEFLRINKYLPKAALYRKFLIYFAPLIALAILVNIIISYDIYINDVLAIITAFIGLTTIPFWLWVGYKVHRKGSMRGRLFLLTNIPLLIGCSIFILIWLMDHLGLIAVNTHMAWVVNIILFGSVLFQLFLFSYVIGYNINRLQAEKLQIQQNINQELEFQVAERTASLTKANQSIEDQRLQLEDLNKVKNKLFSIVSHDLRNPLNSVKGVLELIKGGALDGDALQQIAKKLEGSLDSTMNLLDNLLYWAKSQMEGIQAKPKMIQPKTIIENNLRLSLMLFKEKELQVNSELNDDHAFADPDMIDLVVRNLISNAIKFTPNKGIINLKMSSRNGILKFSLEDNGIGMSDELMKNLFSVEKNHTSYGTNNEKGYGLGLKICKDFIEINGGRLNIESQENKGSIFTVSLPSN